MLKKISFAFGSLWLLFMSCAASLANTSLGIGVAEPTPKPHYAFLRLFLWVQKYEQHFQTSMAQQLIQITHKPCTGFWLILLSFLYGIFHAAGPGHGKAIISSYLIANDETVKRGLLLALIASSLQALSAILLMTSVYFLLPIRWTTAASWVTIASFSIVTLLGFLLLLRTSKELIKKLRHPNQSDCHSAHGEACGCKNLHIIPEEEVQQKLSWRRALSLIFSIGIRPCSGALFVMSFALVNHLYISGIVSVIAMALGTFTTVSALAVIAVKARTIAEKILQKGDKKNSFFLFLEWICAAIIFFIGLSFVISAIITAQANA